MLTVAPLDDHRPPHSDPELVIREARRRQRRRWLFASAALIVVVGSVAAVAASVGGGHASLEHHLRTTATAPTVTVSTAPAGRISGTEVMNAAVSVPVTGPVTVTRVGARAWHKTVRAHDGHFVTTMPAGRYVLTGKDGNAHCSPGTVTVHSDQSVHVTVSCSGM